MVWLIGEVPCKKGAIRPGERVPIRDLLCKVQPSPEFRFGAGAAPPADGERSHGGVPD